MRNPCSCLYNYMPHMPGRHQLRIPHTLALAPPCKHMLLRALSYLDLVTLVPILAGWLPMAWPGWMHLQACLHTGSVFMPMHASVFAGWLPMAWLEWTQCVAS